VGKDLPHKELVGNLPYMKEVSNYNRPVALDKTLVGQWLDYWGMQM